MANDAVYDFTRIYATLRFTAINDYTVNGRPASGVNDDGYPKLNQQDVELLSFNKMQQ